MERVARLGDQAVLHALFPACKMDLSGGVGFFQGTRNGQRRVDMAGRAAGSDQNFHTISLLIGPLPFRLGIACRIQHDGFGFPLLFPQMMQVFPL